MNQINRLPQVINNEQGEACIEDTLVPVCAIVKICKQGGSMEDLQEAYPALSVASFRSALCYYVKNRKAIDKVTEENWFE